jgi:hypothetical protein
MSAPSIGPARHKLLRTYCACLRRAERRIEIAGHIACGFRYDHDYKIAAQARVKSIIRAMRARGFESYAVARMKLQIARSKYRAELEGKYW